MMADCTLSGRNRLCMGNGEAAVDRRVIPSVIDHLAQHTPDAVFASITRTEDINDGFREVTYRKYADIINHAALWLEAQVGKGNHGHTIAYIGPSDLRYVILTVAAVKIRCKMMFLSPRNTLQGQVHLLESADCAYFATPAVIPPGVPAVLRARNVVHLIVPEFGEWLDSPPPPSFEYARAFEDIRHEPIAVLHSSGTTSLPKPVNYTHGCCAASWSQLEYESEDGNPGTSTLTQFAGSSKRLFMGFPMFHAGGLFFALVLSVFAGVQIVLPPPGQPMNGSIANMMHRTKVMDAACLPPSILEEMAKNPSYLAEIGNLQFVITGGAPLPKALGDTVQQSGPQICNMVASTETAVIPSLRVDRDDWQYLHLPPTLGIHFKPYDDETYELVIVRDDDAKIEQAVFQNYPDLQEYSTSDLFRRHPDPKKFHYWISCGRHDDVIALLNGEKFNPNAMEGELQEHPEVLSALMFGRDRVQASLLIEPSKEAVYENDATQGDFLNRLWPTIEKANRHLPAHARLPEDLVLLTSKGKPMRRTPKGSVMRNPTYEDYTREMDTLYEAHADPKQRSRPTTPGGSDPLNVSSLTRTVCQIASWLTVEPKENLFSAGLDSWHVIQIVHKINRNMGDRVLEPAIVYANPSIEQLANALSPRASNDPTKSSPDRKSRLSLMLENLSSNLPAAQNGSPRVALLTGSTGSFGPHLLRVLESHFDKVYCLVRRTPIYSGQKVVYLTVDLANPLLGLTFENYSSLVKEVTHVLHNAWLVDFNLSLDSFSDHLFGVRHLIDFACRAEQRPRIFFVSSIGAVLNATMSPVPEELFFDASVSQVSGYGESKHIAELLLHRAGLASGVKSTILRLGQIAGPAKPETEGSWSKRDWLPSLITSSVKCLDALPDSLGVAEQVDWIPADLLADVVYEILASDSYLRPTTEVFHIVNPSKTTWNALLPTVEEYTKRGSIPLKSWTDGLESSTERMHSFGQGENPAAMLMPFFHSLVENESPLPNLDVTRALSKSATLKSLEAVRPEWMARWLREWGFDAAQSAAPSKTVHFDQGKVQDQPAIPTEECLSPPPMANSIKAMPPTLAMRASTPPEDDDDVSNHTSAIAPANSYNAENSSMITPPPSRAGGRENSPTIPTEAAEVPLPEETEMTSSSSPPVTNTAVTFTA